MAENNWLLNDTVPLGLAQEFATPQAEAAWGWWGFAGEGSEFAAPASEWSATYWSPHEIAFNAAQGGASHQIEPVGIASGAALGQVGLGGTIAAVGLASAASLGAVGVNSTIAPAGFAETPTSGAPAVSATIAPAAISSAAAVGHPTFEAGVVAPADTSGAGVTSRKRARLKLVARPPALLLPHGIASASRVGVPTIDTRDAQRRLARLNSDALMLLAA